MDKSRIAASRQHACEASFLHGKAQVHQNQAAEIPQCAPIWALPSNRHIKKISIGDRTQGGVVSGRRLVKGAWYCGPAFWQVFRGQIAMRIAGAILGLFMGNSIVCASAGAGHAQTLPSEATKRQPYIQVQSVHSDVAAPASQSKTAFPLKASANNRYLVDQNNVPFLMVGDSPQSMPANLSEADAAGYIANRQKYGINTLWISILCPYANVCSTGATTFDGIPPFTGSGDLSTPNPVYFQRVDAMVNFAAANGMAILLDPIDTSNWLDTLRANGIAKAFAYGEFLGKRYKTVPNIVWLHGNDFQSWQNASDDALVQAVARGIRSTDPDHIHTVELNYRTSGSLDDPSWAPLVELSAAYSYYPTYAQVLTEYNRKNFKPVFMVEANYEFESVPNTDGGSTQNLRRQEYWAMLSGAAGQLYGSFYTWRFAEGWKAHLDSPGVIQLVYMKDLFAPRKWYDLIPDQTHEVVVAGYDGLSGLVGKLSAYAENFSAFTAKLSTRIKRMTGLGSLPTNTYATAARTSDGSLVLAYLPSLRSITVDLSKLAGPTTARWYDPTSGEYVAAGDSPLTNLGKKEFTPPGKNAAGDSDWVLVLEASMAQSFAPTRVPANRAILPLPRTVSN